VHKVEGSLTGDGVVKAVVQLPIDTVGLDQRIGERVAFSGELTKVDGLMRKIFLADGQASL
jgi:hypothetical protein